MNPERARSSLVDKQQSVWLEAFVEKLRSKPERMK